MAQPRPAPQPAPPRGRKRLRERGRDRQRPELALRGHARHRHRVAEREAERILARAHIDPGQFRRGRQRVQIAPDLPGLGQEGQERHALSQRQQRERRPAAGQSAAQQVGHERHGKRRARGMAHHQQLVALAPQRLRQGGAKAAHPLGKGGRQRPALPGQQSQIGKRQRRKADPQEEDPRKQEPRQPARRRPDQGGQRLSQQQPRAQRQRGKPGEHRWRHEDRQHRHRPQPEQAQERAGREIDPERAEPARERRQDRLPRRSGNEIGPGQKLDLGVAEARLHRARDAPGCGPPPRAQRQRHLREVGLRRPLPQIELPVEGGRHRFAAGDQEHPPPERSPQLRFRQQVHHPLPSRQEQITPAGPAPGRSRAASRRSSRSRPSA